MVIRMNLRIAPQRLTQNLIRPVRQHLIRIHMQAHTRTRLKHIHHKMLMMLPVQHLLRRPTIASPCSSVINPNSRFASAAASFTIASARIKNGLAFIPADRKIPHRPRSLRPIKRLRRNLNRSKRISFLRVFDILRITSIAYRLDVST